VSPRPSARLLGPWPCENSARAFTEGNRVLPARQFPCRLAVACDEAALEKKVILRVLHARAF
jgi:hypothetical protein